VPKERQLKRKELPSFSEWEKTTRDAADALRYAGGATSRRWKIMSADQYKGIHIVSNLDALISAYKKSCRGSDWKESVQRYGIDIWANVHHTKKALNAGKYRQKPFVEFTLNERGKIRHVKSIHISDRVVQRSLCDNVLTPRVESKLIYDNGASQSGKGPDFTRARLKKHLQSYFRENGTNEGYILLMDYHNYFGSIPHDKLVDTYREIIPEPDLMNLVEYLIRVNPGNYGVGIGAQLSQNAGILYPNRMDQYFKTVKGEKYYGAYMDDRYLICRTKEHARECMQEFYEQSGELGLDINEKKTRIVKLTAGFTFLKFRFVLTKTGKVLMYQDKSMFTRESRRLKAFKRIEMDPTRATECYRSWRGTVLKYKNNFNRIKRMDALFEELFPGVEYRSKEELAKIQRTRKENV
jgi:hypothetical protein